MLSASRYNIPMLSHLNIRNFAIISELTLDFESGLTVVTGETGAGKSIMVDALSLVLGDRADSSVIRSDCDQAEITASFTTDSLAQVNDWLIDQSLDADGECILRRIIHRQKSTKATINGRPVTLQMLKELGELLVDIHGQHAHQGLSKRPIQLTILDQFGRLEKQTIAVQQLWRQWRKTNDQYLKLVAAVDEHNDRKELLSYQVQEMEGLNLTREELCSIEDDHKRLSNISELISTSESELFRLYGDDSQSIYAQLNQSVVAIEKLRTMDPKLADTAELLQGALIQIQEAGQELERYIGQADNDPEQYDQIEHRLGELHQLARKHRTDIEHLYDHYLELFTELSAMSEDASNIESLKKEVLAQKEAWLKEADKLSKARKQAAKKLQKAVNHYLEALGMQGGRFEVEFTALDPEQATSQGLDRIEFQISANPGQPMQPLSKVASGGELSRMSLAIQVVTHNDSSIPCLIFDEVDVGIGGGTAEVVGNLLRELSGRAQVLCVTHQAQVAAKGAQHFCVAKSTAAKQTTTQVTQLDQAQRTEEIARMIGGIEITDQTRKFAREMLDDS